MGWGVSKQKEKKNLKAPLQALGSPTKCQEEHKDIYTHADTVASLLMPNSLAMCKQCLAFLGAVKHFELKLSLINCKKREREKCLLAQNPAHVEGRNRRCLLLFPRAGGEAESICSYWLQPYILFHSVYVSISFCDILAWNLQKTLSKSW